MSLVASGVAVAAEPTVTGVAGIAKDAQGKDITYPLVDTSGRKHNAALITLTIDGKAVEAYCIDLKHPLKRDTYQETAWKTSSVKNLDKVQWLLVHSVPNVAAADVLKAANVERPAGVSDRQLENLVYAATQGAIWHFSDGLEVGESDRPGYATVKAVYDYLVANARSESEPAPTLSITPATATAQVGAKLGPYTVKSSAPATVTVTGGTLVDANGAKVTGPIANGGQFWVTGDTAGKVTVDATADGKVPIGRVFTFGPKPNDHQKIILAGQAKTTVTAQATGSFTPKAPAAPAVPQLPLTGSSAVGAAIAGALLLVGGGVLLMVLRRRRIRFTA
jgi:TQXA domain-containing protein/LPXTG-motif cell wall-anchored protein